MVATEDLHINTNAQSPVDKTETRNSSDEAGSPTTPVESPLIEYQVWCDDTEGREEHFESETPFPQEAFKKSIDGKELRKTSLGGSPAISIVVSILFYHFEFYMKKNRLAHPPVTYYSLT